MPRLRVIPTELLMPDPDVQLDFALEKRRIREMSAAWNRDFALVLVVVPLGGEHKGMYGIIDGRHRFLSGKDLESEWRCDVHEDVTTVAEKAVLKLALDRERRRVRPVEHFLARVMAKDPAAVEMKQIAEEVGFEVGRLSGGGPPHRIEAVSTLEFIYRSLGAKGLRRTLVMNSHWHGDPKTNSADWLRGLGLFVRDGYDEAMTPSAWGRLSGVVPAVVLRHAQAAADGLSRGSHQWGLVAYGVGREIRKKSRLHRRPPVGGGELGL